MPILAKESSVFPESLLSGHLAHCENSRWEVLCTKPRQEKALARDFRANNLPYFLPQAAVCRAEQGRKRISYQPIFPGYVFSLASDESRDWTYFSHRICMRLEVEDQLQFGKELWQIKQALDIKGTAIFESQIPIGQRVRIKSGALEGLEGVVLETRSNRRLVLEVNFLAQGVSFDLSQCAVEII